DQVVRAWPAMEGQLRERGGVAVVGDDHRHAVAALEERPQAELGPVEVHRPADRAGPGVDDARRSEAHAEEGAPVSGAPGGDEVVDEVDRRFAVAPLEGQVDRTEDVAAQVDDRAAELLITKIEADQMAPVGGDAEQDRRLAAARSAAADLLDQAVVNETADEVADGRPRQTGHAREVGARERAVVVQGAQDQTLVERSRLLVRRLFRQRGQAGAHARTDAPPPEHPSLLPASPLARDLTKCILRPSRRLCQEPELTSE